MKIQPVVEGHGEMEAFPVLLRRLRDASGAFGIEVGKPIRRKRSELVREEPLRIAVRLALLQPDCRAIIVLFDGDDDCPAQLAPRIQGWAQDEAGAVPCAVVVAQREYEAWFLAGLDPPHPAPESVRDAKGALDERVGGYLPTIDQPSLSARLDMARAHAGSRSFRHLVKVFGRLIEALGHPAAPWPPDGWVG